MSAQTLNYVSVKQAYTMTVDDEYIGCRGYSAGFTITLPSITTVTKGRTYIIKDDSGSAATYNITIDGSGSETIQGALTYVIDVNYGGVEIMHDGAEWVVVRANRPELVYDKTTVATISTADNVTYTAAQLLGGMILRNTNGDNRSDVTPTAALLVAACPGDAVGASFRFVIRNTAGAAETITVTAGTGVTLSGTMTIAQNNSKEFLAVLTNVTASSEAVTIYSLGTATF